MMLLVMIFRHGVRLVCPEIRFQSVLRILALLLQDTSQQTTMTFPHQTDLAGIWKEHDTKFPQSLEHLPSLLCHLATRLIAVVVFCSLMLRLSFRIRLAFLFSRSFYVGRECTRMHTHRIVQVTANIFPNFTQCLGIRFRGAFRKETSVQHIDPTEQAAKATKERVCPSCHVRLFL